jgi:hypothetical protein
VAWKAGASINTLIDWLPRHSYVNPALFRGLHQGSLELSYNPCPGSWQLPSTSGPWPQYHRTVHYSSECSVHLRYPTSCAATTCVWISMNRNVPGPDRSEGRLLFERVLLLERWSFWWEGASVGGRNTELTDDWGSPKSYLCPDLRDGPECEWRPRGK